MDLLIFEKINGLVGSSSFFDFLGYFFAEYLGYVLLAVLALSLLRNYKKYWRMVAEALTAAVLSRFVLTEVIRFFWHRARPFVDNQVNSLLVHEATGSFPSGHAIFYFALSTVVYFYNKKLGIVFLISSFLISISRVFAGVHWPSDVLAGALLGIISGWLVYKISGKLLKK